MTEVAGETETLPLFDALVAWSDQLLVEAVRQNERCFTLRQLAKFETRPVLSDPKDLNVAERSSQTSEPPDFNTLDAAWRALERDFKRRLVRGGFRLRGIVVWPTRLVDDVNIPAVWAADFEFELTRDALQISGTRYVAVKVHRNVDTTAIDGTRATRGSPLPSPIEGKPSEPVGADPPAKPDAKIRRRGGRKSIVPVLKAVVREHWTEIQANVAKAGGRTHWTEMAHLLQLRMREKKGRTLVQRLPPINTIRTRLRDIYPEVLTEKVAEMQSGQTVKVRS